jgi:carboxymethylenebutenolidase
MHAEWVTFSDGRRGYFARPGGTGPFPAILVYIEAYGLNGHFRALTERLAAEGFAALTPDLFDGATYDYADLPGAIAHLKRLGDDTVVQATERALAWLAERPEVDAGAVAVTGFCLGGRLAFLASAALPARFRAAAAFYGGGIGPLADAFGRPTLLERVPAIEAPLLLWYGGDDAFIRPDEHGRLAEALSRAGKQFTMTVFPGVTHGFFCDERPSYDARAAERSWRATLAFFREHLRR